LYSCYTGVIYSDMRFIIKYDESSTNGIRFYKKEQMAQMLGGKELDDFTSGEVRNIASALKSTGMVGDLRERYKLYFYSAKLRSGLDNNHPRSSSEQQKYSRHFEGPGQPSQPWIWVLRTKKIPGPGEWSIDEETPATNLLFIPNVGRKIIEICKTTDDWFWVDTPSGCWCCDGLDYLTELILRLRFTLLKRAF